METTKTKPETKTPNWTVDDSFDEIDKRNDVVDSMTDAPRIEVEATPTPWEAHKMTANLVDIGALEQGSIASVARWLYGVAGSEQENDANAAQIVRAVNSHQALVDGVKAAMMLIQEYRTAFDDYGLFLGSDNKRVDETLRAALKLAEG